MRHYNYVCMYVMYVCMYESTHNCVCVCLFLYVCSTYIRTLGISLNHSAMYIGMYVCMYVCSTAPTCVMRVWDDSEDHECFHGLVQVSLADQKHHRIADHVDLSSIRRRESRQHTAISFTHTYIHTYIKVKQYFYYDIYTVRISNQYIHTCWYYASGQIQVHVCMYVFIYEDCIHTYIQYMNKISLSYRSLISASMPSFSEWLLLKRERKIFLYLSSKVHFIPEDGGYSARKWS